MFKVALVMFNLNTPLPSSQDEHFTGVDMLPSPLSPQNPLLQSDHLPNSVDHLSLAGGHNNSHCVERTFCVRFSITLNNISFRPVSRETMLLTRKHWKLEVVVVVTAVVAGDTEAVIITRLIVIITIIIIIIITIISFSLPVWLKGSVGDTYLR